MAVRAPPLGCRLVPDTPFGLVSLLTAAVLATPMLSATLFVGVLLPAAWLPAAFLTLVLLAAFLSAALLAALLSLLSAAWLLIVLFVVHGNFLLVAKRIERNRPDHLSPVIRMPCPLKRVVSMHTRLGSGGNIPAGSPCT